MHSSARVLEAEWLEPRLRPFGSAITAIVPDGFPAYVRILHPAHGPYDRPIRWADVAAKSGRTMHRLVQFHAITGGHLCNAPNTGNLASDLLNALCAVLAGHTRTPDKCWFCLWDGYGWLHDHSASSLTASLDAPRVNLPGREYLLFEGPLDDADELGWTMPGRFIPQSPNLFWPQDHAWCVASEIDLYCTIVGGSDALAEALLAESRLEAWRVFPGDPINSDSDKINT